MWRRKRVLDGLRKFLLNLPYEDRRSIESQGVSRLTLIMTLTNRNILAPMSYRLHSYWSKLFKEHKAGANKHSEYIKILSEAIDSTVTAKLLDDSRDMLSGYSNYKMNETGKEYRRWYDFLNNWLRRYNPVLVASVSILLSAIFWNLTRWSISHLGSIAQYVISHVH
jgi:hypothetical protein